jgi:transcriptional regulator with XRE-family HTH domain
MNDFGERVRKLRAKRRDPATDKPWSQDDLAKAVGVSRNTVQSWEAGTLPRGAMLERLVEALDTTSGFLLSGESLIQRAMVGTMKEQPQAQTIPQLRIAAKEFELEAMKLGADDEAIRFIHHMLTSQEAVAIYHGGYTEPASLQAMQKRQTSIMLGLRTWLELYLQQQKERQR